MQLQPINSAAQYYTYAQQSVPICHLPSDLLISIFSLLSKLNLHKCTQVCKLWNREIKQMIGEQLYPQNIVDDFKFLVNEKILSWEEVQRYTPLSSFMTKLLHPDRNEIFIRYGDYTFSSSGAFDVKVDKKGEKNPILLKGNAQYGTKIEKIAVEGPYLFAFWSPNGIVQWDYKKNIIINQIETSTVVSKPASSEIKKTPIVKNNLIFNLDVYYTQEHYEDKKRETKAIEIISYKTNERTFFRTGDYFTDRIIVDKNRIIINVLDNINAFQIDLHHINASLKSEIKTGCNEISDYSLNNNILYIISFFNSLYAIDLATNSTFKYVFYERSVKDIEVIDNLLLYSSFFENDEIHIMDLETKNHIKTLKFPRFSSSQFNREDCFRELVQTIKEHLKPGRPQIIPRPEKWCSIL